MQENPRFAKPQLDIPCRNAILISIDTGDILYEKEPDAEVPMASITKIMTLLLTLEAVEAGKISMTDIVPISEHAFNMGGSQIWLEPGEQFTLDELIKAICVCSANDAAVAVAEFVGGSSAVASAAGAKHEKASAASKTTAGSRIPFFRSIITILLSFAVFQSSI